MVKRACEVECGDVIDVSYDNSSYSEPQWMEVMDIEYTDASLTFVCFKDGKKHYHHFREYDELSVKDGYTEEEE